MTRHQLDHVRAYLAKMREGQVAVADAESTFLGSADEESFQELVGFRIAGLQAPMLAVLHFQNRGLPGILHARESLASYLSNPPRRTSGGPFPTGEGIPVLLPRADEPIPAFLRALRLGRAVSAVTLDPSRIRLAFDFRGHNPSAADAVKRWAGPLGMFAVRTAGGHVLTGRSHTLGRGDATRFVALTNAQQLTPRGFYRVPDLMIDRSWIAIWADITEETARLASRHLAPFLPRDASPELVLGHLGNSERPTKAETAPPVPQSRFPEPAPDVLRRR